MNFVPGLGSCLAEVCLGARPALLPLVCPSLIRRLVPLGQARFLLMVLGRSRPYIHSAFLGLNSRSKTLKNIWRTCLWSLGDPPGQKQRVFALQDQKLPFSQVKSKVCPALGSGCSILQGRAHEYRKPLRIFSPNTFPISLSLSQNILWGKISWFYAARAQHLCRG